MAFEHDVTYAAGIVDGEGWIGVNRTGNGKSYNAGVSVANNHAGLVEWMARTFGGIPHLRRGPRPGCNPAWQVRWNGRKAAAFLSLVYPYLIVKKQQARLILNYLAIVESVRRLMAVKRFHVVPPGIHALRVATFRKLRTLNATGGSWRS